MKLFRRNKVKSIVILGLFYILLGCNIMENKKQEYKAEEVKPIKGTFAFDLDFLKSKDENLIVLNSESWDGQVIVSAKYQAKVFTSTAEGIRGKSFGWINYEAFDTPNDPHMNAYGGENRLWVGSEGGKFSVFFKPGATMEFRNWKTPPPIDSEEWEVSSKNSRKVYLEKNAVLQNYAGIKLKIRLLRDILILEENEIEKMLDITLSEAVKSVGYTTNNALINAGEEEWNKTSGAPCLWILDMFKPSSETVIVVPYKKEATGKVATTDYFGEISSDRIKIEDGHIFYKADGTSRGKIGLTPERAMPVAGSYDAIDNILTITTFDIHKEAVYLNQEWDPSKDPFIGDAVNAYNDGPLEDGSQMGPFYEIESVSPAAFLKPGDSIRHQHNVFHFTGSKEELNRLSLKLLGISLNKIETAL